MSVSAKVKDFLSPKLEQMSSSLFSKHCKYFSCNTNNQSCSCARCTPVVLITSDICTQLTTATLLIFSLQKLKVFTIVQIPLHFHCVLYSHPLHAVDHCTHFELQLEPAFFANPLLHFRPFIYSKKYMFSTANLAFFNCNFIKKWNQICQKKFQKFSKKFSLICYFCQNDFMYKIWNKKNCVPTGICTCDPSHTPPASSRLSPLSHLTFI